MIIRTAPDYNEMQQCIADMCKALGLPGRVAVLQEVAEQHNCQHQLVTIENMSPTTLKEHLKGLKKAGFIKGSLFKPTLSYCINWEKLDEFKNQLDTLYNELKLHQEITSGNRGKCLLRY